MEEVMANMSYCRFENTLEALRDCREHIDADLNGQEERSRSLLITLCRLVIADAKEFGVK